jgi:hypothetical protein
VPGAQHDSVLADGLKPTTHESFTVLDEEEFLGLLSGQTGRRRIDVFRNDTNDAAGKKVRESERVTGADLHIQEA